MEHDGQIALPTARFLTRSQAAAYLGVSPNTFDYEVRAGIWPPARKRGQRAGALTWDRRALDIAADQYLGIAQAQTSDERPTAAEQAALEATARGPSPTNRHKHRNEKAA